MKIETYIENIKRVSKVHANYPRAIEATYVNGYLTGVRDMAADDADISIYDFDNLIDYIGTIRNELEKE